MSDHPENKLLKWWPILAALAVGGVAWGVLSQKVEAQGEEVREATAVNVDQGIDIATLKNMAANQAVWNAEAMLRLNKMLDILNAARRQATKVPNTDETQYALDAGK